MLKGKILPLREGRKSQSLAEDVHQRFTREYDLLPGPGKPPTPPKPPDKGPIMPPPVQLRPGITVHDELALSSTAQDWVEKEQRGRTELLRNILEKDVFLLLGQMRCALREETSFDEGGRARLDSLVAESIQEGGWEKLSSRLRPVLAGLSEEQQGICRRLWDHMSALHSLESAVLKIFTDESPPREDLLKVLGDVCEPLDFDAEEILAYLVLPEPFSLEELRQRTQEFREVLPPEVYSRLADFIIERTILFAREEIGEFSRAFDRIRSLDFPPEAQTKFHEVRRSHNAPFRAAYEPTAKALVFNITDLQKVKIAALLEHVIRHVADITIPDKKAPTAKRRFFPSVDGSQLQADGPLFSRGAFSPLFRKMKSAPVQGFIPIGMPPGSLASGRKGAAPESSTPPLHKGGLPLYNFPPAVNPKPPEPPSTKE
jgi:hypothetical protein